nr:hypothetical protein CFP56_65162 [Quercus suber]
MTGPGSSGCPGEKIVGSLCWIWSSLMGPCSSHQPSTSVGGTGFFCGEIRLPMWQMMAEFQAGRRWSRFNNHGGVGSLRGILDRGDMIVPRLRDDAQVRLETLRSWAGSLMQHIRIAVHESSRRAHIRVVNLVIDELIRGDSNMRIPGLGLNFIDWKMLKTIIEIAGMSYTFR